MISHARALSFQIRHAAFPPIPNARSLSLTFPTFISSGNTATAANSPSPDDIANLILRQKSAALSLRAFRWALRLPSPPPEATLISLFRSLARAGMTPRALQLFDQTPQPFTPSLKLLNSILHLLVNHNIDIARRFFRNKMNGRGDEHTFGILMKGLCRTNRIAEGFKLLTFMKRTVLKPNPVIYNTLIYALCRNGKVGRARSLMAEMDNPSDVTFNIFISAYCREGILVQALVMLEKSFDFGLVPDAIAVTKIVELLCGHDRAKEAVEMLERVEERGGVVDVVAYNTLIKGYCGVAKPEVGRRLVREMERKGCLPNMQTYNLLISGFCELGKIDSAIDLFREMEMDGIFPEFSTCDILIRGFCLVGRVGDGVKLLNMMEEQWGENVNCISPFNNIIYGYYKEGRMEDAYEFLNTRIESYFPRAKERSLRILSFCDEDRIAEALLVYEEMVKEGSLPSVLIYVSLIHGLCKQGEVQKAFDMMNVMMGKGFFPLASTFNCLIHCFCNAGWFVSASMLLKEMESRKCSADSGSYYPLIYYLCEDGEFEKACVFIVQMVERGLTPDFCIWKCLLFSNSLWKKSESSIQIEKVISNCFIDK